MGGCGTIERVSPSVFVAFVGYKKVLQYCMLEVMKILHSYSSEPFDLCAHFF